MTNEKLYKALKVAMEVLEEKGTLQERNGITLVLSRMVFPVDGCEVFERVCIFIDPINDVERSDVVYDFGAHM